MSDAYKPPATPVEPVPAVDARLRPRERVELAGTGIAGVLLAAWCLVSLTRALLAVDALWKPVLALLALLCVFAIRRSVLRIRDGLRGRIRVRATVRAPLDPRLESELHAGRRPRDWELSLADSLALANQPDASDFTILLVASKALDDGELHLAGELLERGLAEAHDWHGELALLAAGHAALVDADVERARSLLAEGRRLLPSDDYPKLAESAVFLAENRLTEAKAALAAFDAHVAGSENPAWTLHGNHWLRDELQARLNQH